MKWNHTLFGVRKSFILKVSLSKFRMSPLNTSVKVVSIYSREKNQFQRVRYFQRKCGQRQLLDPKNVTFQKTHHVYHRIQICKSDFDFNLWKGYQGLPQGRMMDDNWEPNGIRVGI